MSAGGPYDDAADFEDDVRPHYARWSRYDARGDANMQRHLRVYAEKRMPHGGERDGEPSRSEGMLPVQLGDEVVRYRIEGNIAVEVVSSGPRSEREAEHLAREPAYGNMAELGLGILGDFGIEAIGSVLLDEKLGLHIAFGRSDHFGGQVGPPQFSCPEAVVHQDRVYVPALQPRVVAARVDLQREDGVKLALMRAGQFVIDFDDIP